MEEKIRKMIRDRISSVALENGMSLSQACERIEATMRHGLKSTAPEVRAFWRRIPAEEKFPTAEEVVGYLTAVYMGLID